MKRLILIMCFLAGPLWAVQPDEVLDDPVLESRARDLSQELRCLVCRNESIDESNAELARDLRLLVRERLVAGDSNDEAIDFIVDRYGEYVLLKPTTTGANWLLWGAGPAMLLLAAGIGLIYLRGRAKAPRAQDDELSSKEQERLRQILDE
ncbi:cytochrome C biogenesis protein CcdA [Phaeobacter gallaeciensis]|uniref:Cytochrome c-type biogenesis protein n=2 Tax=Roseobacteraceae TaxID=2854170 RepID=A0A366WTH1_9RHOB|nr:MULTISPECIES: cytochrome c-type biogenesis protein [Roseobacteraceae]MBT3140666.1 cytochrome c-type biogenesis protein CcmH [Falsiruegeria litorea]MBT8170405.1 cytochrome c-type biogenesis protein CcmH [Falsiruegeria litorea]RBW52633.1 cytochrome C biogenesis protein CcdA [Phaeobacter gallaeciensis]